jgi:hypothetical protein
MAEHCYAECHFSAFYAECLYAEFRNAECCDAQYRDAECRDAHLLGVTGVSTLDNAVIISYCKWAFQALSTYFIVRLGFQSHLK